MLTSSLGWMGFLLPMTPQGEMVVEFSADDFVGCLGDEAGLFGGEFAEILIDQRSGFFEDAEGANQLGRHGVFADVEVDEGAGGLGAVVAVDGDFDLAHAVGFGAGGTGHDRFCGFGHEWLLEWIQHEFSREEARR